MTHSEFIDWYLLLKAFFVGLGIGATIGFLLGMLWSPK